MALSYVKTPADQRVTVWIGPTSAATGIRKVSEPSVSELNNTNGASGMIPASQSISWNDFELGMEASETLNEPSLADAASYEEFGQNNYGGSISFFLPRQYDDASNLHSLIYDLTDEPGALLDVAVRIDGDTLTSKPAANGDFVSVYRVSGESETNPFTPGESKRRTVGMFQKGDFAYHTIVGPHTILTRVRATDPWKVGTKARIRGVVQGRDYTTALNFVSSNSNVVDVYPGGFYEVKAAGTATITVRDEAAGTSTTIQVTAAA